ncbi:acyltransferase [Streptomyces sp. MST-110588]|uniref:acyltransferase family protein n=1 Tax=Streptomyces sp. MST-110588 TaxID=2833628 RepID=UPI001F5DF249|nr:acyltransferase [Streptomyces sp. MST-110588]UNO41736.1 acyltransferase [Streptomyces sp. MST-110588]
MPAITTARSAPKPVRRSPDDQKLPRRLDSLTSLRFFAAGAVFAHHFSGFGGATGFARVPSLFPYSTIGGHGVTFFFVLSGFLLTWVFKPSERPAAFYWRRIGRIWPAHLLMSVPAIYVFYICAEEHIDWPSVLSSLLLVQAWFPNVTPTLPGNPVTWTLSVEVLFYALFPLLIRGLLRLRTKTLVALTGVGLVGMWAVNWCAAAYFSDATEGWIMRHPLVYLPQFLLGVTVSVAIKRGWRFSLHPAFPLLVLPIYVAGYYQAREKLAPEIVEQLDFAVRPVIAVLAALIIVAFVQREIAGHRGLLNKRALVLLGLWSYSFYLIHQCVIRLAIYTWGRGIDNGSALFAMLGMGTVATGLAWALFRYVEEPAALWWNKVMPASLKQPMTTLRPASSL